MTSLDGQISALSATDVAQSTTNTNLTNSINTNATDITDLQNNKQNLITTGAKLGIDKVDLGVSSLSHVDITAPLQASLNTLQTNIDNAVIAGGGSSKTEIYGTTNYDDTTNLITHTYDEKNLFIDPLDDNLLIQLDLSINSVSNEKNYKQVLVINCLEFKSYVNTLNRKI